MREYNSGDGTLNIVGIVLLIVFLLIVSVAFPLIGIILFIGAILAACGKLNELAEDRAALNKKRAEAEAETPPEDECPF
jgi:ABC-type protease/lipase transport system fused ATPase/permease subunit